MVLAFIWNMTFAWIDSMWSDWTYSVGPNRKLGRWIMSKDTTFRRHNSVSETSSKICCFQFPWLWRMPSSWMWCRVTLVTTYVSEGRIASIIKVKRISDLGTTLAVTSHRSTLSLTFQPLYSCEKIAGWETDYHFMMSYQFSTWRRKQTSFRSIVFCRECKELAAVPKICITSCRVYTSHMPPFAPTCWAAPCQVGPCSLAFCRQSTPRDQQHLYTETVTNWKDSGHSSKWFAAVSPERMIYWSVTALPDTFLRKGFANRRPLKPRHRPFCCQTAMDTSAALSSFTLTCYHPSLASLSLSVFVVLFQRTSQDSFLRNTSLLVRDVYSPFIYVTLSDIMLMVWRPYASYALQITWRMTSSGMLRRVALVRTECFFAAFVGW
jgi:hypothetical protein